MKHVTRKVRTAFSGLKSILAKSFVLSNELKVLAYFMPFNLGTFYYVNFNILFSSIDKMICNV